MIRHVGRTVCVTHTATFTHVWGKKVCLESNKGSDNINEQEDGSYRAYGYQILISDPILNSGEKNLRKIL